MNQETKNQQAPNPALGQNPNPPNSLGLHASVSFGTSEGGPCVGKGVCKLESAEPNAIDANFHISPLDKGILFIIFSLTELAAKQPDQVQYFTDPSGTYQFDKLYVLDNEIFIKQGVLPNASVSPQSPTEVVITNDTVIALIKYDHD